VDENTCVRVAQLINKTNQFNLTTRRYTEPQVRELMHSDAHWFYWFGLRDKFGDHGLVGVLLASKSDMSWTIDSWLMSCRVIGRDLEYFMIKCLSDAARSSGVNRIIAQYIPTAKNGLVKNLLSDFGFSRDATTDSYMADATDLKVLERSRRFRVRAKVATVNL
jgi:FkbH-like protein